MLQLQFPSPPGTPMNVLSGAAFSIWWMMCGSVATRMVWLGDMDREIEDRLGRPDMVGVIDDVRRAFGMRRDRRAGMLGLQLQQLGFAERLVDDADAGPQQHVAPGLAGQIAAQMPVRPEDDLLLLRNLLQDHVGR